jgi:hypothetical protein
MRGGRQIRWLREHLGTPFLRGFYVLILIASLGIFTDILGQKARLQRLILSDPEKIYLIPNPGWIRALTMGYNEAAADLAWIRALIYFGEETGRYGKFEHLDDHIELILALDPRFQRAYMWAGVITIYSRAVFTRERVEKAIEYLRRGLAVFPGDGEMHYMLGFDLYFELPPFMRDDGESEEEIRKVKLEGIDQFKQAIVSGTGPEWLVALVSSLLKRNGLVDLAIQSIEENLKYVEDPEAQKKLIDRLRELKGERATTGYEKEILSLQQEWSRDYPYLPLDMYLLVEPRALAHLPPLASLPSELDSAMDVLDELSLKE